MGIVVREARPDEFEALGGIVVAAYREVGALEGDEGYAAELRKGMQVAECLAQGDLTVDIGETTHDEIGMLLKKMDTTLVSRASRLHVSYERSAGRRKLKLASCF